MQEAEQWIREQLFELQDEAYGEFQSKLIPTVERERIIGVRTPALRKLAREVKGDPRASAFLQCLPHDYYEENNLHGFLIEFIRDYEACVRAVDAFLPYVDNWATCDMMSPKVLGRHREALLAPIGRWMSSGEIYTIRYGIGQLMAHYLDEAFDAAFPAMVASVVSDAYYVNMMRAWYFATALAKQWEAVLPYIEERRLDEWTHRKAIQKAIESRRITDSQKAYLRSLKERTDSQI